MRFSLVPQFRIWTMDIGNAVGDVENIIKLSVNE